MCIDAQTLASRPRPPSFMRPLPGDECSRDATGRHLHPVVPSGRHPDLESSPHVRREYGHRGFRPGHGRPELPHRSTKANTAGSPSCWTAPAPPSPTRRGPTPAAGTGLAEHRRRARRHRPQAARRDSSGAGFDSHCFRTVPGLRSFIPQRVLAPVATRADLIHWGQLPGFDDPLRVSGVEWALRSSFLHPVVLRAVRQDINSLWRRPISERTDLTTAWTADERRDSGLAAAQKLSFRSKPSGNTGTKSGCP